MSLDVQLNYVSINSTSHKGSGETHIKAKVVKSDLFPLIPLPIREAVGNYYNFTINNDVVSINSTSHKGSGQPTVMKTAEEIEAEFPLIPLPIREAVRNIRKKQINNREKFPLIPLPIREAVCHR